MLFYLEYSFGFGWFCFHLHFHVNLRIHPNLQSPLDLSNLSSTFYYTPSDKPWAFCLFWYGSTNRPMLFSNIKTIPHINKIPSRYEQNFLIRQIESLCLIVYFFDQLIFCYILVYLLLKLNIVSEGVVFLNCGGQLESVYKII